jgi:lipopolysaccharide biosynthesis glycosyltransferase
MRDTAIQKSLLVEGRMDRANKHTRDDFNRGIILHNIRVKSEHWLSNHFLSFLSSNNERLLQQEILLRIYTQAIAVQNLKQPTKIPFLYTS